MLFKKNKIGVLGIGAIGTVISYELQKNGSNELFYYSRTPQSTLKIISGKIGFEIPINIQTTIIDSFKLDWLIICLKEHQYRDAQNWFLKLINSNTKVVVIRNGLNLKEPMLNFAIEKKVLECMIDCPTQQEKERFYAPLKKPIITLAKNQLANEFKLLFKENCIKVNEVTDFKTENWKKICESSALGSILCLTGETCWVFKEEKMRMLYLDIIQEALLVARADGAKIESNFIDNMMTKLMAYPETKGSSMLTDRLNGRPIEIGAKNGVISKLGKQYGIKTPINDLMVTLLSQINKKEQA